MKITDSLEKVYTAMGGSDPFKKDNVAEGIDQISEVASGGGGGGAAFGITPLGVLYEDDTFTIQKTWQELYETNQSQIIFLDYVSQLAYISVGNVYEDDGVYYAYAIFLNDDTIGSITFSCASADGYPAYTD